MRNALPKPGCKRNRCCRQSDWADRRQRSIALASSPSDRTATRCRQAVASTGSPASSPVSKSFVRCTRHICASIIRSKSSIFSPRSRATYGLSCVGSRGMSGALEASMLDMKEPEGETLARGATTRRRQSGSDPDRAPRRHQGISRIAHRTGHRTRDRSRVDVGIVTSIVGIRRIEIVFEGAADHAGTTPMASAARCAGRSCEHSPSIRRIAERLSAAGCGLFRGHRRYPYDRAGSVKRRSGPNAGWLSTCGRRIRP